MSVTHEKVCLYCSEILKPGIAHTKCDEEQGRRLSGGLCLVCAKPMGDEHNIEHATCHDKTYQGYSN